MRIYHILFLAICSLALNIQSKGQKKIGENAVQITGACLVSDSLYPAPYVSIFRNRDHRGTYSNRDGYFTIPALEGDTLTFVCTGLKTSFFVVPVTEEHQMQIVQVMEMEALELSPLYILPYPAPHELKREILALDLPGDGHQLFKRDDVSLASFDGMNDFSTMAYENASAILTARYSNGFVSGGNILSNDAWRSFIGGFRPKRKN
jgi:hypothetical protein